MRSMREIRDHVKDAFGRVGVAGEIDVEGDQLVLSGHGPAVRLSVGAAVEDWPNLAPDVRQRRCNELARRLAGLRRAAMERARPEPASRHVSVSPWLLILPVVGVLGAAGYMIQARDEPIAEASSSSKPAMPAPPASASAGIEQRDLRAQRVCAATAARVARGATVGPTDVEGWEIEAAFLGEHAGEGLLDDYLQLANPGTYVVTWAEAPKISEQKSASTRAVISRGTGPDGAPELRITFGGRYVTPYFTQDHRIQFVRLAQAIATRLGATQAGLYARCHGAPSRHVGSWFYATSVGETPLALVRFMRPPVGPRPGETEQHPPAPAGSAQAPTGAGGGGGLSTLLQAAPVGITRDAVTRWVAPAGGMVSGTNKTVSTIMFPFRDASRAARAAHLVAQQLGTGR